jgi:hypothetical protein
MQMLGGRPGAGAPAAERDDDYRQAPAGGRAAGSGGRREEPFEDDIPF